LALWAGLLLRDLYQFGFSMYDDDDEFRFWLITCHRKLFVIWEVLLTILDKWEKTGGQ